MKKLILLLALVLVATVILVSCGTTPDTSETTTDNTPTDSTPADSGSNTVGTSTDKPSAPTTPADTTDEFGNLASNMVVPSYTENDFTYVIFKDGAKLVSYDGNATEVTVPASIQDGAVKVVSIATSSFKDHDALTKVVISKGVTTLGNDVFYGCLALSDVTLPDSITKIGDGIFRFCSSLEKVVLPDSITSMGSDVFFNCKSLTDVTLPKDLTMIPAETFYNCVSLKEISVPANVFAIGEKAFYYCTALESFSFTEKMTAMGEKAFYNCTSLAAVNLPESIITIPKYAFFNCESLTSLKMGSKVKTIGAYAFYNCGKLDTLTIPAAVNTIAAGAFAYCTGITEVTLPAAVTSIDARVFYRCSALKTINLAEGVTSIGDAAFAYTGLKSFEIPATVESVGVSAFSYCSALESITFEAGSKIAAISQLAFAYDTALKTVVLPESAITINNGAFHSCTELENVTLSPVTKKIALNAFVNCAKVKEFVLPDTLTDVGRNSIGVSVSGNTVTVNENTKIYAFSGGPAYNFLKANGIPFESLGVAGCVPFSEMVVELVPGTENEYIITKYTGNATTLVFAESYKTEGSKIVGIAANFLKGNENVVSVTLPDTVATIGASAFENCVNLASVNMPTALTAVNEYTFKNTAITSAKLPNAITVIGKGAFDGCSALAELGIPSSLTTLGDRAFAGTKIRTVSLPRNVATIGDEVFKDCTSLLSVTLQGAAPTVGKDLITNTTPLNCLHVLELYAGETGFNLTREEGANFLTGNWNGYPCTTANSTTGVFKSFTLQDPSNEKSTVTVDILYNGRMNVIGNPIGVSGATIPSFESAEDLPWYEYRQYISTLSVTKIISIGNYAFAELPNIVTLSLSTPLNNIGDYAFIGSGIQTLALPSTLKTIGKGAFSGLSISTLTLPTQLTEIADETFANCSKLTTLTIPDAVTKIGARAFINSGITLVNMPAAVYTVGDEAYKNCTALTAVTTYAADIGKSAFEGCSELSALTISTTQDPDPEDSTKKVTRSLTNLGEKALKGTAITTVNLPSTVKSIGNEAFADCSKLTEIYLLGAAPTVGTGLLNNTPAYAHIFYHKNNADSYTVVDGKWNGYKVTNNTGDVLATFTVDGGNTTLTIYYNGTMSATVGENGGKIPSYASAEETPWYEYRAFVTNLSIASVSSVGDNAFRDFDRINRINLGTRTTSIGAYAFEGCDSLGTVSIYAATIGEQAFANCPRLNTATLNNPQVFGYHAFANCTSLSTVTISGAIGSTAASSADAFYNTPYNK